MAKIKSRVSLPSECSICSMRTVGVPSKPVLICSLCSLEAHLACTALPDIPDDAWLCATCQLKSNATNVWGDLAADTGRLAETLQEMASQAAAANQKTQGAMHRAEQMEISEMKWRSQRQKFESMTKAATSRAKKAEKALEVAEIRVKKAETELDHFKRQMLAADEIFSELKHCLYQAQIETTDLSKQLSVFKSSSHYSSLSTNKRKNLKNTKSHQNHNNNEMNDIINSKEKHTTSLLSSTPSFPSIGKLSNHSISSKHQLLDMHSSLSSSPTTLMNSNPHFNDKNIRYLLLTLSRLEAKIENASSCLMNRITHDG